MKQFFKTGVAIAAFALSGFANAGTVTATYNGNTTSIDSTHPFSFSFDLTSAAYAYVPQFDSITSARLLFSFKDTGADNARNPNNEEFSINLGSFVNGTYVAGPVVGTSGGVINIPNGIGSDGTNYGPFAITGVSLENLSNTGKLSLQVTATSGAFQFVGSTLTAEVEPGKVVPPAAAVPEPFSLSLLGIGLVGFAASRRRKA